MSSQSRSKRCERKRYRNAIPFYTLERLVRSLIVF